MADAVLVNPKGFKLINDQTLPFGLLYASIYACQEYEIKIIDQRIDKDWKEKFLNELEKKPLIVGITSMTGPQILDALEISKIAKGHGVKVAWGGIHASLTPKQTLENEYIDFVICGEAELTFHELVKALDKNLPLENVNGLWYKENGQIKANPQRNDIKLEDLPRLPYYLVEDMEKYIQIKETRGNRRSINIFTSRGCPNKCTYCFNQKFNKGYWRQMSAKRAIEEIRYVVEKFKLENIFILDDNFFFNIPRTKEIAQGIMDMNLDFTWDVLGAEIDTLRRVDRDYIDFLAKSRCKSLLFGIESGSPRILKLIKKNMAVEDVLYVNKMLKGSGLKAYYSFMSGFPTETDEDLKMTVSLMLRLKEENPNIEYGTVKPVIVYPGTELFDVALKEGYQPPKRLEDWAHVTWGNYSKLNYPWLSKKRKTMLTDLYYYSLLMNPDHLYINSKLFTTVARAYYPIAKYRVRHLNFMLPFLSRSINFVQNHFM